jgi:hypothetical protein
MKPHHDPGNACDRPVRGKLPARSPPSAALAPLNSPGIASAAAKAKLQINGFGLPSPHIKNPLG